MPGNKIPSTPIFQLVQFQTESGSLISPPPPPPLQEEEIHLWRLQGPRLEGKTSLQLCEPLFQFYFGSEIHIQRNENGKPMALTSHEILPHEIQFSISHTESTLGIAFVKGHQIGLDLEDLGNQRSWRSISQRYFSNSEQHQLMQLPESKQIDFFYKLWTLKESYIKCFGHSLFTGIQTAQFEVNEDEIQLRDNSQLTKPLYFMHQKDSHYFSITLTKAGLIQPI